MSLWKLNIQYCIPPSYSIRQTHCRVYTKCSTIVIWPVMQPNHPIPCKKKGHFYSERPNFAHSWWSFNVFSTMKLTHLSSLYPLQFTYINDLWLLFTENCFIFFQIHKPPGRKEKKLCNTKKSRVSKQLFFSTRPANWADRESTPLSWPQTLFSSHAHARCRWVLRFPPIPVTTALLLQYRVLCCDAVEEEIHWLTIRDPMFV